MEKKNIAITVLIIALVASGVGNIVLVLIGNPPAAAPSAGNTYVRATSSGPKTLELTDSWDSASNDVIEQVVQTLFFWDLANVDLPRINVLAQSFYFADETHLQIALKQGILFHDGTPFNAEAAKWSLDRLLYLTNCTGTNTGAVAHTQSLWMFPDGVTPIISDVATVGTYNITLTLSGAYAPILSLLTYANSGMISPTSHAVDATSFIPLTAGRLVGTGPFKYVSYTPNVEVRFTRWDDYYEKPANFKTVIYALYSDSTTAHNAYLGGTIDENAMFADQNLATYEADPAHFVVKRFSVDEDRPSLVYQYLGVNNKKVNVTWRQALAFSINYTYCINVLRQGNALRSLSPISPGFGESYNSSLTPGTFGIPPNDGDVTKARELMVSMGFGDMGWTDSQWRAVANSTTPFRTIRNTYNTGNQYREDLFVALTNWFAAIGVAVEDDGVLFTQFLDYLDNVGVGPDEGWNHLEVYAIGWGPDYLDPFNMLDPLLNPVSISNSAQVNDTTLNAMMTAALEETDSVARNNIYKDIQYYFATNFFHIPIYHSLVTITHKANIYGYPYNAMGSTDIYPQWRGLYPPFGP